MNIANTIPQSHIRQPGTGQVITTEVNSQQNIGMSGQTTVSQESSVATASMASKIIQIEETPAMITTVTTSTAPIQVEEHTRLIQETREIVGAQGYVQASGMNSQQMYGNQQFVQQQQQIPQQQFVQQQCNQQQFVQQPSVIQTGFSSTGYTSTGLNAQPNIIQIGLPHQQYQLQQTNVVHSQSLPMTVNSYSTGNTVTESPYDENMNPGDRRLMRDRFRTWRHQRRAEGRRQERLVRLRKAPVNRIRSKIQKVDLEMEELSIELQQLFQERQYILSLLSEKEGTVFTGQQVY